MAGCIFHEQLWARVTPGLQPESWCRRRDFVLAGVDEGDRVLDLGCGEGHFAAEIAARGATVVGVDVAEEPLRRARDAHRMLDFRLIEAHGPWPFPDSSFDVVWAGEVIEHVLDTTHWLSELRRVLHSGGRLMISTPDHGRVWRLGVALRSGAFERHFDPRGDHLRFYTAASLRALLTDFGFDRVEVTAVGGLPGARRTLLATAVRKRF